MYTQISQWNDLIRKLWPDAMSLPNLYEKHNPYKQLICACATTNRYRSLLNMLQDTLPQVLSFILNCKQDARLHELSLRWFLRVFAEILWLRKLIFSAVV